MVLFVGHGNLFGCSDGSICFHNSPAQLNVGVRRLMTMPIGEQLMSSLSIVSSIVCLPYWLAPLTRL